MKIHTIEITNYKAFLGTHKIDVGGKNLFIYGENGSGKSSLYYALKDFFQSSVEDIDLGELENIFVPTAKQGKTSISVVFKSKLRKYTTQDFWNVIKSDMSNQIKSDIEKYRALVLNPFSHYNTESHEIGRELRNAIQAVKNLKGELN